MHALEGDNNKKETLSPASLQYFISSLASLTVGLGNQDMGFIRRINQATSHGQKTYEGKKY